MSNTLVEKTKLYHKLADEICEKYVDITQIWVNLDDVPVAEIEEMQKVVDRKVDVVKNLNNEDVLRLACHLQHGNLVFFAHSTPVRVLEQKPYEEISTPLNYNQLPC